VASKTRTLADLEAEVRERCDALESRLPGGAGSELDRRINAKLRRLYRLINKLDPDLNMEPITPISVAAGTQSYTLPSGYWQFGAVDYLDDSGQWQRMPKVSLASRNRFQGSSCKGTTAYRFMGGKVYLFPIPTWSGSIRLWGIPAPLDLATPSAEVEGYAGYEELAVLEAAMSFKAQWGEDVSAEIEEQKQLLADIYDAVAGTRDQGEGRVWRDPEEEDLEAFQLPTV
jgi:hypothetical protein